MEIEDNYNDFEVDNDEDLEHDDDTDVEDDAQTPATKNTSDDKMFLKPPVPGKITSGGGVDNNTRKRSIELQQQQQQVDNAFRFVRQISNDNEVSRVQFMRCFSNDSTQPYIIISSSDVYKGMQLELEKIRHTLDGISLVYLRLLMSHFQWNLDELINQCTALDADGNPNINHVLKSANLPQISGSSITSSIASNSAATTATTCGICMEDLDSGEVFTPSSCGHSNHKACWIDYVSGKIRNVAGGSDRIQCCHCDVLIDDASIRFLVQHDPELLKRFDKAITNAFVRNHPNYAWCPGKHCNMAVRVRRNLTREGVHCHECNKMFCFRCGATQHEPISCNVLQLWKKMKLVDEGNLDEYNVDIQKCPKCKYKLYRATGCKHMTCIMCKYEFCWECLGDYRKHDNKYCEEVKYKWEARENKVKLKAQLKNRFKDVKKLYDSRKVYFKQPPSTTTTSDSGDANSSSSTENSKYAIDLKNSLKKMAEMYNVNLFPFLNDFVVTLMQCHCCLRNAAVHRLMNTEETINVQLLDQLIEQLTAHTDKMQNLLESGEEKVPKNVNIVKRLSLFDRNNRNPKFNVPGMIEAAKRLCASISEDVSIFEFSGKGEHNAFENDMVDIPDDEDQS